MKCRDCNACVIHNYEPWCNGVKEPFKIINIYNNCTEYNEEYWNNALGKSYNSVNTAIKYFEQWIKDDLKELDGDTESDYAKFILDKHNHIHTALNIMKQHKS